MENTPNNDPSKHNDGSGRHHGTYNTIAGFQQNTNTILTNAQHEAILPYLERRGYSKDDLVQKLVENDQLRTLNEAQKAKQGDQQEGSDHYGDAHDALHKQYMADLKYARMVFQNNSRAQIALGLNGSRVRSQSGFAAQGMMFYSNALESKDFMAGLATKRISEDDLKAGQAAFRRLVGLTAIHTEKTGIAVGGTKTRDDAYDALHSWMSELIQTAKIELEDHPELLKQMGL